MGVHTLNTAKGVWFARDKRDTAKETKKIFFINRYKKVLEGS
jgi:hypothetical protein